MARKTGLSRRKLRTLKKNDFIVRPNAHLGQKATTTVLTGYTDFLDDQLQKDNRNSSLLFEWIREKSEDIKAANFLAKSYYALI